MFDRLLSGPFSPTLGFALGNEATVHLNINEDVGHFAAPRRPSALFRRVGTLLVEGQRRVGEKERSKRDGEAVAITSDNERYIKSVLGYVRQFQFKEQGEPQE
jgi:hypothetical protein